MAIKRWLLTLRLLPKEEFSGQKLLITQGMAVAIAISCLLMFAVSIPARSSELNVLAQQVSANLANTTVENPDVLFSLAQALPNYGLMFEVAVMLLYFFTSLLIFWTRSDEWIALFTVAGLSAFALHITPTLNAWMIARSDLAIIGHLFKGVGIGFGLLFLYLFPGGYYAPIWMRIFLPAWIGWVILWLLFPDSIFSFRDPYTISVPGFLLLMFWWGTGIFAQIYRYFRVSPPLERQQTKLITFGATIAALGYCLYIPMRQMMTRLPQPELAQAVFQMIAPYFYLVTVAAIPVTIAFSILRYRLWDIDIIIRRTLLYSTMTGVLAVVYLTSVLFLEQIFRSGSDGSRITIVLSTLISVMLSRPLWRRIQDTIDKKFYRGRYDAEKTLGEFSTLLRREVSLEKLSDALIEVVQQTVQPEQIALWVRLAPEAGLTKTGSFVEIEKNLNEFDGI